MDKGGAKAERGYPGPMRGLFITKEECVPVNVNSVSVHAGNKVRRAGGGDAPGHHHRKCDDVIR